MGSFIERLSSLQRSNCTIIIEKGPQKLSFIGERERANLVVRTAWFFYIYIYISSTATYRNTRLLILRTLVQFFILPHTPPPPSRVRVVRLSRATADSAWLSKQLENGASRPRPFEAAERGKHAYPDSGHQAYPRQWASNSLNYAGGRNFTVSSQVLSRQNSAQHSWIAPARQKCHAFTY